MYEIDFSPPNQGASSKETTKTPHLLRILKSKIVWAGIVISCTLFFYGKHHIERTYSTAHQERVYSDVEFMDNANLSKTYELNFESPTAKSIYTIEYQNYGLENLKKIVSLMNNDLETLKNVIPVEINGAIVSKFQRGNENTLLVTAETKSSINKFPIVVTYALHFIGENLVKIQIFLYTDDDFILQDKLGVSKSANWHKKQIIIGDKNISIFEADLTEPVIEKKEPIIIEDPEVEIITNTPTSNVQELEEDDENITKEDLAKHESTEEDGIEENETIIEIDSNTKRNESIKTSSVKREPKEVFLH